MYTYSKRTGAKRSKVTTEVYVRRLAHNIACGINLPLYGLREPYIKETENGNELAYRTRKLNGWLLDSYVTTYEEYWSEDRYSVPISQSYSYTEMGFYLNVDGRIMYFKYEYSLNKRESSTQR